MHAFLTTADLGRHGDAVMRCHGDYLADRRNNYM